MTAVRGLPRQLSHLGAAHATELGADGSPVLRLSVSGVSSSLPLRKDADGRLGLQFAEGTPSVQGTVTQEQAAAIFSVKTSASSWPDLLPSCCE